MNQANQTVVSDEMMERLRKAGMGEGYEPVPANLQKHAERVLGGKDIADMDKRLRYLTRKKKVTDGNRRHEARLREAKERLIAQGLLQPTLEG